MGVLIELIAMLKRVKQPTSLEYGRSVKCRFSGIRRKPGVSADTCQGRHVLSRGPFPSEQGSCSSVLKPGLGVGTNLASKKAQTTHLTRAHISQIGGIDAI